MSGLPEGWGTSTIGELSEYVSRGKSPQYAETSSLPVVNQRCIRWGGIENQHLKYIHPDQIGQWSEERFIKEGDILWNSTGTGTIGRACLVKVENLAPPKVVDSHVTIVRPNPFAIDPRYLFAWIRGRKVQATIEALATGTTNQIELSRGTVVGTVVPLCPLAEQKRIADKLDALLARVDACRERLDRVPGILKRFRQAVLAAATSGELTREWRESRRVGSMVELVARLKPVARTRRGVLESSGKPEEFSFDFPTSWYVGTAADLIQRGVIIDLKDGNHGANHPRLSDFSSVGIPFITAAQVADFKIDYEGAYCLSGSPLSKIRVGFAKPGDVVLTHKGSVGRVGLIERECVLTPQTTYYRVNRKYVVPEYLMYFMASPAFSSQLDELKSQTTRDFVPISAQYGLTHLLPPIEEQHEIVRRLNNLFRNAREMENRVVRAQRRKDRITGAILGSAFRGELVPQDPNDEPAVKLLARIHAAAGSETAKPRRGRRARGLSGQQ